MSKMSSGCVPTSGDRWNDDNSEQFISKRPSSISVLRGRTAAPPRECATAPRRDPPAAGHDDQRHRTAEDDTVAALTLELAKLSKRRYL
jgi:hypothetical protein